MRSELWAWVQACVGLGELPSEVRKKATSGEEDSSSFTDRRHKLMTGTGAAPTEPEHQWAVQMKG